MYRDPFLLCEYCGQDYFTCTCKWEYNELLQEEVVTYE